MKVEGIKTTHENVTLNVRMQDILDGIEKELKKTFKVGATWYINRERVWEDWYDTGHGSGLTTEHRSATVQEIEAMNALTILENMLKDAQ